jgi:putative ABC transport system permease protein
MFKNYFKTAVRNLARNKIFSAINVFGLAIGLACCLLIAVYVYDELSYDKYPEKAGQIYRVGIYATGNGEVETYPNPDVAVGEGIKNTFPEVQDYTRLMRQGEQYVSYEDKKFKEQYFNFADSNFLQVFSIPFIQGDVKTALVEPNSIVINRALAVKYFGNEDPMGKSLKTGKGSVKVTGVIDKVPENSHFHFDAFISMSTLHLSSQTWSNIGFYTYVVLNKGTDPKKLEAKFPQLVAKYVVPEVIHDMGVSLAEAQKSVNTFRFFLQPLTDIHLHSSTKYELEPNGDIKYVYIFGALSLFILLLACVNFTNLSTASSAKRSREVGIRKVMGSVKKQLIAQFLIESVLLTFCAAIFAVLLTILLLPYFNQLAGKHISYDFFFSYQSVIAVVSLCLLVGIVAGIYPAFFLSSFKTISVLKGSTVARGNRKSILRSGLVAFQFFVSTALIIATIIVYQQLNYMREKNPGYNTEQVVFLQDTYLLGDRNARNIFKEQLMKDSRIVQASTGIDVPGSPNLDGTQAFPKDKETSENDAEIHINIYHVDYEYMATLGMKVIKGRNFSREFPSDSFAVVINEAAVRDMGWSNENAIGKTIVTSGKHEYQVVGIVSNFHYTSVKQKIAPLMMQLGNTRNGLIVKIKAIDVENTLARIKTQWNVFNPGAPFEYYFLDDKFASLYSAEQRTGQIFTVFAIIAIVIATLGLFGLTAFMTEQRTKEIGIRKTLGASVQGLLLLLSKDFLLLVIISFFISVPVTWWSMHQWLQAFAYRIHIGWPVFAIAGLLAIVIALITVSFQSIKAAIANPVKSLRSE